VGNAPRERQGLRSGGHYTGAMVKGGRHKTKAFFVALGAITVALAIALNIGWIVLSWRTGVMLVLGVLFFGLLIAGAVLNTIFLIREIRRNEQHDAFINSVTHELKTPIASLRLYLQTLQTRDVDETKRHEFYDIMLADSERLMTTIDQVLRAARTASSKPVLNTEVNLREIVSECVSIALTRHHLQPEALEFVDASSRTGNVLGEADELRAAVFNLIDNAVKYSGPNARIVVEFTSSGPNYFSVRVRDNGVGIPASELKRIFKRFYRIPTAMALRIKGTGLGLFIVRSVAERHGGRAWAESEGPGHGSTFTLELPAAPAHR
jgi:two-component system, OmpR family, sensor histidine kinase SenX3